MKLSQVKENVNVASSMIVCFDVSKSKLNLYTRFTKAKDNALMQIDDEIKNRTKVIVSNLKSLYKLALQNGYDSLSVVCEPTGGYEKRLLQLARKEGFKTAYVSGESVKKYKTVESNDTGKTDQKDARVIHCLASDNRLLSCREYSDQYRLMRNIHTIYEEINDDLVAKKNILHSTVRKLFPDFSLKNKYLFTKTGSGFVKVTGCNPYKISKISLLDLEAKVRAYVNVRGDSLITLKDDADANALHQISMLEAEILEKRVRELHQDCENLIARKEELVEELVKIYRTLPISDKLKDIPRVSENILARSIAELGPLSEFKTMKQLLRYSGLNLREKKSGTYAGKVKITKRGRGVIRKVLYQLAFSCLIKKNQLYHEYYVEAKERVANGGKALTSVMRKFVKLIWGLSKSEGRFELGRVFECEGQWKNAS